MSTRQEQKEQAHAARLAAELQHRCTRRTVLAVNAVSAVIFATCIVVILWAAIGSYR
jgi:hypothetical protein